MRVGLPSPWDNIGEDDESCRSQRDQGIRPQAGEPVMPLSLKSDDRAERDSGRQINRSLFNGKCHYCLQHHWYIGVFSDYPRSHVRLSEATG